MTPILADFFDFYLLKIRVIPPQADHQRSIKSLSIRQEFYCLDTNLDKPKSNKCRTLMIETRNYPRKSLGQNFLRDENIARKIIAGLSINQNNHILEIGPGTGALTKYLVKMAGLVVAVEIDKNLVKQLQEQLLGYSNFVLHQNDILKTSFEEILEEKHHWKVVANLPYHITSPVLFKLFNDRFFFDSAVFMIQKEVADRIIASPGSKTYGILSVFSQFYSDIQKLFDVSRHVFYPRPGVSSSVIRLVFKHNRLLNQNEEALFRKLVKGTFGQRRKQLSNSLRSIFEKKFDPAQLEFDLAKRPENLSVDDFVELTKKVGAVLLNTQN